MGLSGKTAAQRRMFIARSPILFSSELSEMLTFRSIRRSAKSRAVPFYKHFVPTALFPHLLKPSRMKLLSFQPGCDAASWLLHFAPSALGGALYRSSFDRKLS